MAACCCCCGREGENVIEEKVVDNVFETEPPATELEYIDEFLEPQTTKEMTTAESYLETPPPEMEMQESFPITHIQEEDLERQTPKFGYWNIRGRGEQIRLLCQHLEEEYIEDIYTFGPGPECESSDWEERKKLEEYADLELPYWIEGKLRLSGTIDIMEHIAEKHNMLSDKGETRESLRNVNDEINELRRDLEEFSNDEDWESNISLFLRRIASKLYRLSNVLGNKNWISGKKMNYPDFNLYDLLDMLRTLSSEALENFDKLQNFMLRFEGLKHVKAYIRMDEFKKRPFFSPKAAWNATQT